MIKYPSAWSEWERSEERQQWVSYRATGPGSILLPPDLGRVPADNIVQSNTNMITEI